MRHLGTTDLTISVEETLRFKGRFDGTEEILGKVRFRPYNLPSVSIEAKERMPDGGIGTIYSGYDLAPDELRAILYVLQNGADRDPRVNSWDSSGLGK